MLKINIANKKGFFYYRRLELITSVHIRCWKCSGEKNKELTIPRVLLWPTLFLYTLSSAEMLPVEWSVVD